MQIVIPMAGEGSRFQQQGFTFPKPLIQMPDGEPMIRMVINCMGIKNADWHFIVRKEHEEKYSLSRLLPKMTAFWNPHSTNVHQIDTLTEGAACTVLEVTSYINNEKPLFVVNSDQYFTWDRDEFFASMKYQGADGGILTFRSLHPRWSFVRLADNGDVIEVAEKEPISDIATVGTYFWEKGRFFVESASSMVEKDLRINGEFYVAPTFNEMIADHKKIRIFDVKFMAGVGTPEDYHRFEIMTWMGKVPNYG